MDDFVGAENVISKERLAELSQRSNGPATRYFLSHFGAMAVTTAGLYWTQNTWLCVPFFIMQGILIGFLYAPEHECDHFTAFKDRWMNVALARVCGFFLLLPNDDHRWGHYAHHRYTQDWEKDTELTARPVLTTAWRYLLVLSGFPGVIGRVKAMFLYAAGRLDPPYLTPAQKATIELSARIHLVLYAMLFGAALAMQSWWPVYYWLGPFVLTQWVYRLQGLGEHVCLTHEPHTLLNTRTLKTNAFMRWVNWNMTYHTVHHTYPSVPFYRLPQLHQEVEEALGFELPGAPYFKLHWDHLRALMAGATELDLSAEHDRSLIEQGRMP